MADAPFISLPSLDFHPEMFEHFIRERGIPLTWEKATLCPCLRIDQSGKLQFTCGDCYNGNRYVDSQPILGAVTNIQNQRNAQIFGDLALGGIYLTVEGKYRLGVNDRISLTQQTARYAEKCEFATTKVKADTGPGATSLLVEHTRRFPTPPPGQYVTVAIAGQTIRYTAKTATTLDGIPVAGPGAITTLIPANTPATTLEFALRYEPVQVYNVGTLVGNAVVDLQEGTDYEFLGQRLRCDPARPQTMVTVLYESRPVFLVDSLPHAYRDQITNVGQFTGDLMRLPVAAVCRLDFVNRIN